jgi:hypothetical protein|tara:strand:- start:909 stop:1379 length:471 start_codon:yes stop_codon:yes gene_type:complete
MEQFLFVSLTALLAVIVSTALFYECLCLISKFVSGMTAKHRTIMLIMTGGIFIAHGLVILLYAFLSYFLTNFAGFAELSGNVTGDFLTHIYFSATSYSSLGIGDVFPVEGLRFLTGVETINGLILITWSAAFTYFSIEKMWEAHGIEPKFCKGCEQ